MNMRSGETGLADRPWLYWGLIGASVVVAVLIGYGVGTVLFSTPDEAQAAAGATPAVPVLRIPITPTVPPTTTPAADRRGAPQPPAATPTDSPCGRRRPTRLAHCRRTRQCREHAGAADGYSNAAQQPRTARRTRRPPTNTPVPPHSHATGTATNTLRADGDQHGNRLRRTPQHAVPPTATATSTATSTLAGGDQYGIAHTDEHAAAAASHSHQHPCADGDINCGANSHTGAARNQRQQQRPRQGFWPGQGQGPGSRQRPRQRQRSGQGNGKDKGQDKGKHKGQDNGKDNGQDKGQDKGKDKGNGNGKDKGHGKGKGKG